MNIAEAAIRNRTTTLVLTAVLFVGGILAFGNLARLEDPEFTIKEALIITPYPGASAAQVEEEVSDRVELAVQQLGQLLEVESYSARGQSIVTAVIKDQYDKHALPQVWDELRRKVGDIQGELPPGAGPSIVNDDYGDVWGVFLAIYGPEYSFAELREYAKLLRRELLLVKDVSKIDFWGDRSEAIYIEPDRDRMAQLGIHPSEIIERIRDENLVADAGRVRVGPEYIAVAPTGNISAVDDFGDLLISERGDEGQIYLRDVAETRRGYVEPPVNVLRHNGHLAIGLGISTVTGGNVVEMGQALEARARELLGQTPLGIEFGIVSLQSEAVTVAINGFLVSLMQAVGIVVAVLLLFMGVRSGLIIGFVLVLTILASFIFMQPWGVALERISLGALVIALGMLVDNAIVVVDGMLVRIRRGMDSVEAAKEVVSQTAIPLLGATAVAVMAFGAIGLSQDSTGEFCRSLFQVVLISLGLSWITAVTVTPLLGVMFLKAPKEGGEKDPYGGLLYRGYKGFLVGCLRFRWLTMAVVLAVFGASLWAFQFVENSFFPNSTRPQFMMDVWLPQGTHIEDSIETAQQVEDYLAGLPGATGVTTFAGGGGMRFLLTYAPEKTNSAYLQFLVDVQDYRTIDDLISQAERDLTDQHPDTLVYGRKFLLGPGDGGKIQARFSGPDADVLRGVAEQAEAILYDDGGAKSIRSDWRQRVKMVRPVIAEEEANLAGITNQDVAEAIKVGFDGETLGVYRERDELLPIVLRAEAAERQDAASLNNLQIWSDAAQETIPLRQVVSEFETLYEDDILMRLNRKRTITVHADPKTGVPSVLLDRIRPLVEDIEMPPGYELEWWGEYRDSRKAQAGIGASLPFWFLGMVLIVIALFNSLRKPLVIWLVVPLAVIGVTGGLLAFRQPFGFMALLGFMSLSGMLVKNAIVLIDEIQLLESRGTEPFDSVVRAGVSRLLPVAMAALTTALGMIPLLFDAFFVAMAVTIIAGLVVATVLTMIVVPVLYAIFFNVKQDRDRSRGVPRTAPAAA